MKHLKTSINNLVRATENRRNARHRSMIIEDQFRIEINIFVSFNERIGSRESMLIIYLILYDLYNIFAPLSGHYKFRLSYYETQAFVCSILCAPRGGNIVVCYSK